MTASSATRRTVHRARPSGGLLHTIATKRCFWLSSSTGNIFVAGETSSTTFPPRPSITPNPTAGYLIELNPLLGASPYTVLLGAQINRLAIYQPRPRLPIVTYPSIFTTGFRFTGGSGANNTDAFVVRINEVPVNQQFLSASTDAK